MSNETNALAPGRDVLAEIFDHKRGEVAARKARRSLAELQQAGKAVSLIGGADVAAELDAKRAIDQGTRAAAAL